MLDREVLSLFVRDKSGETEVKHIATGHKIRIALRSSVKQKEITALVILSGDLPPGESFHISQVMIHC